MDNPALEAHLARRHGVVSLGEAQALGLTGRQVERRLASGRWVRVHRGVYALGAVTPSPLAATLAACLAAGPDAVASHGSAAWLWGMAEQPPAQPEITVPLRQHRRLGGMRVHRRAHPGRAGRPRRGIPVTSPLRTVVDLAATCPAAELDTAIDTALARRLIRVEQLIAVVERPGALGPRGIPALRAALHRRGFLGAPTPSVLESLVLRLLMGWGYEPLGCEVVSPDGRYRVDFLLRKDVVLECDGFAYHSSPEAKASDSHRRNDLRACGFVVIETDWVTATRHPERLRAELEAVLGSRPRTKLER